MNTLTIDFETRSTVDLRKTTPWVYAEHPSTDIMCLALKMNDEPTMVCSPIEAFDALIPTARRLQNSAVQNLIERADIIEAHNAEFEVAIWRHVMHGRYNFLDLDPLKMRDTAARAAACALPRKLGDVCAVLGLQNQKDGRGRAVMMKLTKPRKSGEWWEDPKDIRVLLDYCVADVEAEHELSKILPQLSADELEVWRLDQRINRRGVAVDVEAARRMADLCDAQAQRLKTRYQELTGCAVMSPSQVGETLRWLAEHGVDLPDLTKGTVTEVLKREDLPPDVREVIEIRQSSAKSSTAKFQSLIERTNADGRMRSNLMYHGASTGRWSGKGFQPQNLPRACVTDPEALFREAWSPTQVELLWGDPLFVASAAVRPVIVAADGMELFVGDFASIEAIGTAWVAGQQDTLDAFTRGLDLYLLAASSIYGKPYDQVTKAERQIGKVATLALGYQGGVGAFNTMAAGYGIEPLPEDEVRPIVAAWREANPEVVRFWRQIEAAALEAVRDPGCVTGYRSIQFRTHGNFLCLRLPSGRIIRYYDPRITEKPMPWDETELRDSLTFMGIDSARNHQWVQQDTYGGKLTENIVQALARDLCANAMLAAERNGYPVVLSVHDEVVSEREIGNGSVEEFNEIITQLPPWANGLPLKAETWKGPRYKK